MVCVIFDPRGVLPVRTLSCQACQGQVTVVPATAPSARGPPWWGQIPSIAEITPSVLKIAYTRPSYSISLAAPGGSSSRVAIFTKRDIRPSLPCHHRPIPSPSRCDGPSPRGRAGSAPPRLPVPGSLAQSRGLSQTQDRPGTKPAPRPGRSASLTTDEYPAEIRHRPHRPPTEVR